MNVENLFMYLVDSFQLLNSRSKIETQASVNLKKKTIMHVITHITLGLKGQTA